MDFWRLVGRSLLYYWRTNVAVLLGVATAVAVLSGALLVGHSVRASLADLVRTRLGATDLVVTSPLFVREQLAADIAAQTQFADAFAAAAPLIVADGVVTEQQSGRRAGRVKVYGVDDRFWRFHSAAAVPLGEREAALSPALAREIQAQSGAAILVRVQRPSDIPLESLHSRKDDVGRTLRVTTQAVLDASSMGEFALDASQGDVLAVFVPLDRLRTELEVGARVNTILLKRRDRSDAQAGADLEDANGLLEAAIEPQDVGLTTRVSDDGRAVIVGSSAGLVDDRQQRAIAATSIGSARQEVFTYLANTMRVGNREIPYSLVTGLDLASIAAEANTRAPNEGRPIVLNEWAARELDARIGDRLSMDFYLWQEPGQLVTRSAEFRVAGRVPIESGSRDLAPDYPGISNTASLRDWDPPFPLDLRRVRPIDEEYWDRYRTTPKAFVRIEDARALWGSRYGSLTSIRVAPGSGEDATSLLGPVSAALKSVIMPAEFGLVVRDVRAQGMAASQGATDFGEYFVYFSFFLVVSALVLVVLFFKLGVEQRVREVGLLRAVGVSPGAIRRLFATEGLLLAIAGSVLGVLGAIAYASQLMTALTTRWVDAVGTTALTLHVDPPSLAAGAAAGVVAAVVCIWWTLRGLRRISERSLLAGEISSAVAERPQSKLTATVAIALAIFGAAAVALAAAGLVPAAAGFFGGGAAMLVSLLAFAGAALRRPSRRPIGGHGWRPVSHLAVRQASHRPGRSVLSMAVIACATFILVTVDAFRRDGGIDTTARQGGTGGYQLMVRTLLPVVHDPNSEAGRDVLNLRELDRSTALEPFRVLPGDDASCLNLYQPTNPRIVAPRDAFLAEGRFAFQSSVAQSDEERRNPWMLLHRVEPDGAVPVIADANSMTYVLHRGVGDDLVITSSGTPVTLRFVAALRDSIFQSEVLMSEANFRKLFPDRPGFQLLLVETHGEAAAVAGEIEQGLSDAGADAVDAGDYLASFHRVENTYLSTFQALGGLGLLLGTIGLATVLLRNVLERRRELALLAAVGYRRSHFLVMAVAENLLIVCTGLGAGAICAAIAIAPAAADRGARIPLSGGAAVLLFLVFVVAMLSSLVAMAVVTKSPILGALRSE